jgi:uncharacterized protein (DUF924 family)
MSFHNVIAFWFEEIDPKCWWRADEAFDNLIRSRFGSFHARAASHGLPDWRTEPRGRLAEIIVLDQFSRNLYRGTAQAFENDPLALDLAQDAIRIGVAGQLVPVQRAFLYLPFMHSESAADHQTAMTLFTEPGLEPNLAAEIRHKAIIDRFGRYPHRNVALGRESTEEELAFLKTPGSSF